MTEDDFIARYFAPLAGPAALSLKDDTALYAPPLGHELVITADAIVAGVHFFADDAPEQIARKALRVNISDIAAKGAEPQGFLMTFATPRDIGEDWVGRFAQALGEDAQLYRCPLMGGDTVSTPGPLSISITVIGSTPAGQMVRRSGARAGDLIYVSGTIGDGALGLYGRMAQAPAWMQGLASAQRDHLVARYLEPQPRLALAPVVRAHAHGAMDVSDGLVGDLAKMMRVSGVAARVELARVPLSDAARAACSDAGAFDIAVTGGDDYEILCTIAPQNAGSFEADALQAGVAVTRIGEVLAGTVGEAAFIGADGLRRTFAHGSFSHF